MTDGHSTFERYAERLEVWRLVEAGTLDAEAVVSAVRELDEAVAQVEGRGFEPTPFSQWPQLAEAAGVGGAELWVKDETGNVSGSHKARHLFGVALAHRLATIAGAGDALGGVAGAAGALGASQPDVAGAGDALGGVAGAAGALGASQPDVAGVGDVLGGVAGGAGALGVSQPDVAGVGDVLGGAGALGAPFAIASCGNAALAAAVVARAVGRPLDVYVPEWANDAVVAQIADLGGRVRRCRRSPGVPGDPAHHAMLSAIGSGAVPFSCQGTETPTAIDGARTMAWEIVETLLAHDQAGRARLDRLFVQVGGGALATAVVTGLSAAAAAGYLAPEPATAAPTGRTGMAASSTLGDLSRLPVVHAVQPEGNHPLVRAWDTLAAELLRRPAPSSNAARVAAAHALGAMEIDPGGSVERRLRDSPQRYMRVWEDEPASYATGILDDVTYDWMEIVEAMLVSGGCPLVASEEHLHRAHRLARLHTGIDVCPTGASGLGGLLAWVDAAREAGGGVAFGPQFWKLSGRASAGERMTERMAVLFTGRLRPGDPDPLANGPNRPMRPNRPTSAMAGAEPAGAAAGGAGQASQAAVEAGVSSGLRRGRPVSAVAGAEPAGAAAGGAGQASRAAVEAGVPSRQTADELLGSLAPYVDERHRRTIGVLLLTFQAGRRIEAWLSETVAANGLDTSGYAALSALWLTGPPHRMTAGELAERIVQTSGGLTKTVQRLADRGLVRRVTDPGDGRRSLLELTTEGLRLARETLELVLNAFDSEIGHLDEAEREGVATAVQRLMAEFSERLNR